MRRLRRLGLALAVVPAVLAQLALAPPAPAQVPKRESAEIGDKQQDLQQTQKRLFEERQKAADARKREAGVLSELEGIDRRLGEKRQQVAALDGRLKRAQSDVGELQGEIGRLQSRRSGQEDVLGRRLRALYKLQAQGGVLPIVLSGADPVEQAVQLRHLTTLASVDARLIREYRVTSEVLADRKGRVEARGREMASLRTEADQERAEFDQEAAKRRALLAKVQGERAYHDRMVGDLSEATRRLEAFIRDLQEKQRRAVAKVPPPSRPARPAPGDASPGPGFAGLRGRLSWPADGRVVAEYGPQVNPRFGTKTFRNGIDIEATEGSNIAAVFPGHVVYTGWFRGYGNLIIVDHGGEYYTVYAHAADIRVTEGDEVKQGQLIGTVGDTGSLQGPRLYFEVRHEGKPQDPAQWLRPRS
jgi:murein hydrolase activator